MAEESADQPSEEEVIRLVAERPGEEIGFGISAKVHRAEIVELREGMSAKVDQKGMSAQAEPQPEAQPPQKPSDAATSATPPAKDS